jgi:hypothetical protein
MSYDTTLAAVRDLSENATLRPAARRLRLTRPDDALAPRRAIIPFEDLHRPRIGGTAGTAGDYRPSKKRSAWPC